MARHHEPSARRFRARPGERARGGERPVRIFEDFFRDLDTQWHWPVDVKIPLRLIGSAALMLQTGYERGTKDSDVLETANLTDEIKGRLLSVAGQGSELFERHRLYLEIVARGI